MNTYKEFNTFQLKQEKRFQPRIHTIFKAQNKTVLNYARVHGVHQTIGALDILVRPEPMAKELGYLYRSVGALSAIAMNGVIRGWIGKKAGGLSAAFGRALNWGQRIIDLFHLFGAKKVKAITNTTKDFLRRKLQEAEQNNLTYNELVDSIQQSDVPLVRSRVIARTETVAASNMGRMNAANESGILMEKQWQNSGDKRVREKHQDYPEGVGGERVPLNEPFSNGMQHPGDPNADADEVCNCRCVLLMHPMRDANGFVIRV